MLNLVDKRAQQWLASARLRPTRQRLLLASFLVGDGKNRHVCAETLYNQVQKAKERVSLATVYNTLRVFCDAGLLNEIVVDGAKTYFDTCTDDHPHFYCEDTGKLTDAPKEQLSIESLPKAPEGTKVSRVDVVIRVRSIRCMT